MGGGYSQSAPITTRKSVLNGIGAACVLLELTNPERISNRLCLSFVRFIVVDDERILILGIIRIARISYCALD